MPLRLLNGYEELTYGALLSACEPNGARVFPKVRVADVLKLESSGISSTHFGYGLRSHFDFVVTDERSYPLFGVEFDGPLHETDQVQIARDHLKNELCDHFEFPLLRINTRYLTKSYRGLDLLTYFVEAWFLEKAFSDAQRGGAVPYDEPFDMTFVYSTGRDSEPKWPYWLSLDIQETFRALHDKGSIGQMAPSHIVATDADQNHHCLSWLVFDEGHVIEVRTGMRAQRFPAVDESDLVPMLAMFDMLPKVQKALKGNRADLIERERFFSERLPAFEQKYRMCSSLSVGPTV